MKTRRWPFIRTKSPPTKKNTRRRTSRTIFRKLISRIQLAWFIIRLRVRFFFIAHPLIGPLPKSLAGSGGLFERVRNFWSGIPPVAKPFAWAGLVGMVFAFLLFLFAFTPPLGKVKNEMSFLVTGKDGKTKKMVVRRTSPDFVRLAYCPSYVRGAIIVSEDANFYRHRGVDFVEIWQAILEHFSYGERLRGASTITQQVAKNAYLSRERSFLRKMKEYFLARRLERALTKEEILDYYVNGVEFGDQIYGIRAAARLYFQKDPSALGPAEAATLAFFLPNPIKRGRDFIEGRDSAFRDKSVSWAVYQIAAQGYMPKSYAPVQASTSTNETPVSTTETNQAAPSTNAP